jgi:DNA-binding transcriptional regulator YiaG
MPNIAAMLKDEIRRLARREVRLQLGKTQRAAAQYRQDIARLKHLLDEHDKELKRLRHQLQGRAGQPPAEKGPLTGIRFSARSVKAQRQRLGLSAAHYGRLLGVSGLTVYNWEHNKSRPRKAQLAALVAVRGIGKREVVKKLRELGHPAAKRRPRRAKR